MAVIVKRTVECDYKGCHSTRNVKKWGTLAKEGESRRSPLLCTEHRKLIDAFWRALVAPSSGKGSKPVYESLDDIPRV